jgi:hypothetical protein
MLIYRTSLDRKYPWPSDSKVPLLSRQLAIWQNRILIVLFACFAVPCLSGQSKSEAETPTLEDKSFVELTELRQLLEKEIPPLQVDVDALTAKLQERESLEREKAYLERTYANVSPDTPLALKRVIKRQADEAKARVDLAETTQAKADLLRDLNDKKTVLEEKKRQKNKIEQRISELIDIEKPRQKFKTSMSAFFAALVALVIVGFFIVAWKDETVRREIFSGQSGIQFVTLFSLVIAIILFGITGILQDKELAALLGGLSGYILGRGTARASRGPQGNAHEPRQDNKREAAGTPRQKKAETDVS